MNKIKGNIVVGQSGGPTALINASVAGVYRAAKEKGVARVYGIEGNEAVYEQIFSIMEE